MEAIQSVSDQLVDFYYNTFDADRKQLVPLYRNQSILTFESKITVGAAAIVEKLANLPFVQVKHQITTKDCQPTINDGIIVLVTGQLLVDEEQRPMNFSQTFQLVKEGNGYYVHNDIFKLIYG